MTSNRTFAAGSPDVFLRAYDHLRKLGILSLAALVAGGSTLLFVGANAIDRRYRQFWENVQFKVGAHLPLQAWLAIIGLAFGSTSYGLSEAFIHLFDWWSARQARGARGLDYAKYLNTLPRAPVGYGIRGFPAWMTLKYLILIASIAASIGYKFSLVRTEILEGYEMSYYWIDHQEQPSTNLLRSDGMHSPWLTDRFLRKSYTTTPSQLPSGFGLETIFNESSASRQDQWVSKDVSNSTVAYPATLWMAAIIYFGKLPAADFGLQSTMREIIMIANLTEHGDNFTMSRENPSLESGWRRMKTSSKDWFSSNTNTSSAIVDYRLRSSGNIEIQWAPETYWLSEDRMSNSSTPVTRRLVYELRYGVKAITRSLAAADPGASRLNYGDISDTILSTNDDKILFKGNASKFNERCGPWVDAMISAADSLPLDGISTYLQLAMAFLASKTDPEGPKVGYVEPDVTPFGPEDHDLAMEYFRAQEENRFPSTPAPPSLNQPWIVYQNNAGLVGCVHAAAVSYIVLGSFAILICLLRIWVGPPELTSWTGQHIYLAVRGDIVGADGLFEGFASGREAATKEVGHLRLGS